MTTRVMTAERVSILVGILIAMLTTLLRYVANGVAQDRLILLCIAAVVVLGVAVASWRLLCQAYDEGAWKLLGSAFLQGGLPLKLRSILPHQRSSMWLHD